MDGKLIVIEGLDGCGKSTQLEMLKNNYDKARFISFPNYDSPSGEIIKSYLNGDFSEDSAIKGCYTASSFYAVDRYISYKTDWEKDYKDGKTVVAARYTTSNAIYQMAKLDECDRESFLCWLEDYEYVKFGIPKPDIVVFLDMPIEISQQLLTARYGGDDSKKDIHEKNIRFLHDCREAALYAAQRQGWKLLCCAENGQPLSVETINKKLIELIEEMNGE